MPSHVYHEVDIAAVGNDIYWVSWGDANFGELMSTPTFVSNFVREFTFDTRYEVEPTGRDSRPSAPVLACFVSSGGAGLDESGIYAYEIEGPGRYNRPKEAGWEYQICHFWDESERLALTAMAYLLLSRARWMEEQEEYSE